MKAGAVRTPRPLLRCCLLLRCCRLARRWAAVRGLLRGAAATPPPTKPWGARQNQRGPSREERTVGGWAQAGQPGGGLDEGARDDGADAVGALNWQEQRAQLLQTKEPCAGRGFILGWASWPPHGTQELTVATDHQQFVVRGGQPQRPRSHRGSVRCR